MRGGARQGDQRRWVLTGAYFKTAKAQHRAGVTPRVWREGGVVRHSWSDPTKGGLAHKHANPRQMSGPQEPCLTAIHQ